MANLKFRTTPDRDGWEIVNPVTGDVELTIILPDDAATLHNVTLYGAKQIAADGGADEKGQPLHVRIRGMRQRWADVINGAWGFRDGHGGKSAKFPDRLLFEACVACGHLKNDTATKALWAASTDVSRAKAYRQKGVMEWLEEHTEQPDDTDELWG